MRRSAEAVLPISSCALFPSFFVHSLAHAFMSGVIIEQPPFDEEAKIDISSSSQSDSSGDHVRVIDEKRLMRKIDLYLVPWLTLLYLLNFLDRTNIGNARLYGLEKDLHITDSQYNIALMLFFLSYSIFEVPSNLVLKRFKPSIWLSFIMVLWGIVMVSQGLIHNRSSLLAVRWLLGMAEAGLFPGVNYYLSCWYKRSELGTRVSLFFGAVTVSGAFGGLLSIAIAKMDGVGGKPAWAWIFIIEGLATIVIALASFYMIQDFPATAKFLTEEERAAVFHRLQADQRASVIGEKFKWKHVKSALTDRKICISTIIYAAANMPAYAFSLFLPTILNELGFDVTNANLLTVPVFVVACIFLVTIATYGDKRGHRAVLNLISFSIGAAGFIILIFSKNATLSYVAVYLAAGGVYAVMPNTIAWISSNVDGSYKRAVALAMAIGFGGLNGMVSSNIYRGQDKPRYRLGHGIVLLYIGVGIISTIVYHTLLSRENSRRDRGERTEFIIGISTEEDREVSSRNGVFDNVTDAKREKGDEWSGYRYSL